MIRAPWGGTQSAPKRSEDDLERQINYGTRSEDDLERQINYDTRSDDDLIQINYKGNKRSPTFV